MRHIKILLFLISSNILYGQKSEYYYQKYGVEEGLPSIAVYCAIEDKDGFMWFGTDGGISKFNGYEFLTYTMEEGLTDNTVFRLYEDFEGKIWYLSFKGGIGYIKNDSVHSYKYNQRLIDNVLSNCRDNLEKIRVDTNGAIKFSMSTHGYGEVSANGKISFTEFTNSKASELIISNDNEPNVYYLIGKDKRQNKLIIKNKNSGDLTVPNVKVSGSQIEKVFQINKSEIFFTYQVVIKSGLESSELGLGYLNTNLNKVITRNIEEPLTTMFIDKQNRIWVCKVNNGIEMYENIQDFFNYKKPIRTILEGVNVSGVLNDNNMGVWLTTENNGVYHLMNQQTENIKIDGVEQKNRITSLTKDQKGEIFYSNEFGEIYTNEKKHELYAQRYGDITKIQFNYDNQLLISRHEMGGGKYASQTRVFCGRTFHVMKNNDILISHGNNLVLFEKEGTRLKTNEFGNDLYYAIFEDINGEIWLGGKKGLSLFDYKKTNTVDFLPKNYENTVVKAIGQTSDGTLLLATDRYGLFFLNIENEPKVVDILRFKNYIFKSIYVDEDQDIWLSSNKGIIRLHKTESDEYSIQKVSRDNGLPSNEVNYVTSSGDIIYVATNEGLAIFNKKKIRRNLTPSKLHIQSIFVNGEKKTQSNLFLEYDQNNIEINFIGLSYQNSANVNYKYILEGIEKTWQFTKSRKIRYPLLPPGRYTFKVMTGNQDDIWSEEETISFEIYSPFWKTLGFISLTSLLGIFIVVLILKKWERIRLKNLKKSRTIEKQKREIVEIELRALRAQMNPHFTFNTLNSIQSYINNSNPEMASTYIGQFSLLMRRILEDSKHNSVTIVREIEMLRLYLDLENMRLENLITYDIIIDEKIDIEIQKIPSMIIQPFVENSIIHGLSAKKSGERKITIEMKQMEDTIFCAIEDTGIGRERSEEINKKKGLIRESFGMKITQNRLEMFSRDNGKKLPFSVIDLKDSEDKAIGTRIEVNF